MKASFKSISLTSSIILFILALIVLIVFDKKQSFNFLSIFASAFFYIYVYLQRKERTLPKEVEMIEMEIANKIAFICPYCNARVNEEDKICPECNANLKDIAPKIYIKCQHCHEFVDCENEVCPKCGSQINIEHFD